MARRTRRTSAEVLEEKITKQQETVAKARNHYEESKAVLADLLKQRDEIRKEELMNAVANSKRSYEDIMKYIKGAGK